MRLATVNQFREIEDLSQKVYGLSGEILMESAGALAAREIEQSFFPELNKGMISVVCGPGNNGGDGLVVARHLHSSGYRDLRVFVIGSKNQHASLFKLQLRRVELSGIQVIDLSQTPKKLDMLKSSGLIIDAVFGIGYHNKPAAPFQKAIEVINSTKCSVVSLDTPSGLDCDRGVIETVAVKAAMTITFGLAKPGFFIADGPSCVGKLRILSIGFPFECLRGVATSHFVFNDKLARRYLPQRKNTTNKSDYGRVLVIAGHEGMWGAGILTSSSAYRMGAGYVTWVSEDKPSDLLRESPELLTLSLEDPKIWKTDWSTVVIGPGLGINKKYVPILQKLKKQKCSVVVDADALSLCQQENLFPLPNHWVITPHTGELARILKVSVQEIEKDRFKYALLATQKLKCLVLLKGYRSILAHGKRCMVINSGNSALAKAGTGDVLAGMIAGLMAQGLESIQATATAAYIHGRMADEWVRVGNDKRTLNASDLKNHLPQLISRIATGSLI